VITRLALLPLTPVASSVIRSIGYVRLAPEFRAQAPGYGWTIVRLHSGGTWAYLTPRLVYHKIRFAKSKGCAYNAHLRGKFPALRVDV